MGKIIKLSIITLSVLTLLCRVTGLESAEVGESTAKKARLELEDQESDGAESDWSDDEPSSDFEDIFDIVTQEKYQALIRLMEGHIDAELLQDLLAVDFEKIKKTLCSAQYEDDVLRIDWAKNVCVDSDDNDIVDDYPVLIANSLLMNSFSEDEQRARLLAMIENNKKVVLPQDSEKFNLLDYHSQKSRKREFSLFPPTEYNEWLTVAQKVSPSLYENLKACETDCNVPCLRQSNDREPNNTQEGKVVCGKSGVFWPIIRLPNDLDLKWAQGVVYYLRVDCLATIKNYGPLQPLGPEELAKALATLKDVDPALYRRITTIDSTGSQNIFRNYDGEIVVVPTRPFYSHSTDNTDEMRLDYLKEMIKNSISRAERELILNCLKEINPTIYEMIIRVDPTGGSHIKRMIRNDKDLDTVSVSVTSDGLPLIFIGNKFVSDNDIETVKFVLEHELEHYISEHLNRKLIPRAERDFILNCLKEIDPVIYEMIIRVDPTGKSHIMRMIRDIEDLGNASASVASDGLPLISISNKLTSVNDIQTVKSILRHELGHYISGHPSRKSISPSVCAKDSMLSKLGDEFQKAMQLASRRAKEWEADRASIMQFDQAEEGIEASITRFKKYERRIAKNAQSYRLTYEKIITSLMDSGLSKKEACERFFNQVKKEAIDELRMSIKKPEQRTFGCTHPPCDRYHGEIQQASDLEDEEYQKRRVTRRSYMEGELTREVELMRQQGRFPAPINWEALRDMYLNDQQSPVPAP